MTTEEEEAYLRIYCATLSGLVASEINAGEVEWEKELIKKARVIADWGFAEWRERGLEGERAALWPEGKQRADRERKKGEAAK